MGAGKFVLRSDDLVYFTRALSEDEVEYLSGLGLIKPRLPDRDRPDWTGQYCQMLMRNNIPRSVYQPEMRDILNAAMEHYEKEKQK